MSILSVKWLNIVESALAICSFLIESLFLTLSQTNVSVTRWGGLANKGNFSLLITSLAQIISGKSMQVWPKTMNGQLTAGGRRTSRIYRHLCRVVGKRKPVKPWAFKLVIYRDSLLSKVINLGSDTFGNPIFQKGLQNKPSSLTISVLGFFA